MILDNIKNLSLYENVHPQIKRCVEFLATTNAKDLAPGKYEIDGKNLYFNVLECETKAPNLFEAHDKYADLQYVVEGKERMDYAPRAECKAETEYDEIKDVIKISAEKFSPISVKSGEFALFLPHDAHRPGVTDGEVTRNKKIVFKIKL